MGNPVVPADAGRFPHRMAARIACAIRSAVFRGEGGPSPLPSPAAPGRPTTRLRFRLTNIPDPEAVAEPRAEGPEPLERAEVVDLAYGRCGEGEEIHAILKSDFAGGDDAAPEVRGERLLVAMGGGVARGGGAAAGVRPGGRLAAGADEAAAGEVPCGGAVVRRGRRVALVLPAPEREAFRDALARLDALPIRC